MRRLLSALGALALLCTTAVFAAAPASAVPCSSYPPGLCQAEIFASRNVLAAGDTFEGSGLIYYPNEDVRITIGGIFVGTAHTDPNGAFDPALVVPLTLSGDQVMTGTGAHGTPDDVASTLLHIVGGTEATSTHKGSGPLASTGVQIAAILGAALVLIGGGLAISVIGRRRRATATHLN
jgi:hypothetical protein